MEESGVGKGNQSKDGSLARSQSSLELLSNTALGVAKEGGSSGNKKRSEEQEESVSADSGDTTESARVTPSISQGSIAAAAAVADSTNGGAVNKGSSGDLQEHTKRAGDGSHPVSRIPSIKHPGAMVLSQGYVPNSPYLSHPSVVVGSDPTGLPIDHYSGSSFQVGPPLPQPPPLQPTFLPESYYAHPHYYTAASGGPAHHPPPASLITLAPPPAMQQAPPTPPFANASSKRGGLNATTHAAFIPPRSSSVRMSSAPIEGNPAQLSPTTTQYQAVGRHPSYPVSHPSLGHAQASTGHVASLSGANDPHHAVRPAAPLDPCESFQSDSTGSLVSEQKFSHGSHKLLPKKNRTTEKSLEKQGRPLTIATKVSKDSFTELSTENQLLQERNAELQQELEKRDQEIAFLRKEVRDLDLKVKELRQFPSGKISQIPMADMLEIMQIYGSEVSDTVMPPRKQNIQKASVIRQFRRWNPNFLKFFFFKDGKWHPKLGKEGELARRMTTRKKGLKTKPYIGEPEELSPQQPNRSQEENNKQGESSDNDDADPSLWTIHNNTHTSDHASAPASPSSMSLSPGGNRKRKLDDDNKTNNKNG